MPTRLRAWLEQPGRPLEVALFLVVFATHAYFYNGGGWAQNARLDIIYAFVEPGPGQYTFQIDRFLSDPDGGVNTGDWSSHAGHYYANKAPAVSLLAIPPYFVLHGLERAAGMDPTTTLLRHGNAYLLNLWLSVFWTALASVVLLRVSRRHLGHRLGDGLAIALTYAFATMALPFDSQLWGHTTAAALMLLGFAYLLFEGERGLIPGGFFVALAAAGHYLSLLAVPVAIALALAGPRPLNRLLRLGLGASPWIVVLLGYHQICFGDPFTTAASAAVKNPVFVEAGKLEGQFAGFSFEAFFGQLVLLRRGLFWYMPILALAIPGAVSLVRRGHGRLVATSAAIIAGAVLTISCFNGWHGGWTTGPRYLLYTLPFWCLLLPRPSRSQTMKIAFVLLATWSFLNMTVAVTVDPMVPFLVENPLYGELWPRFLRGELKGAAVVTAPGAPAANGSGR